MTLVEIEELAREYVRLEDTILAPSDEDMALARFVLRVLPVLRAAEGAIEGARRYNSAAIWLDSSAGEKLANALDAFRGGDK